MQSWHCSKRLAMAQTALGQVGTLLKALHQRYLAQRRKRNYPHDLRHGFNGRFIAMARRWMLLLRILYLR